MVRQVVTIRFAPFQLLPSVVLAHSIGSIAAGKQADLCAWRIESLAELGYWVGLPGPERRIFSGLDS